MWCLIPIMMLCRLLEV